jgi:hypothetical protein
MTFWDYLNANPDAANILAGSVLTFAILVGLGIFAMLLAKAVK